jgi:hypothetical protein
MGQLYRMAIEPNTKFVPTSEPKILDLNWRSHVMRGIYASTSCRNVLRRLGVSFILIIYTTMDTSINIGAQLLIVKILASENK